MLWATSSPLYYLPWVLAPAVLRLLPPPAEMVDRDLARGSIFRAPCNTEQAHSASQ